MTKDFILLELFAFFYAVGIDICIWCIWKVIYVLAKEYKAESEDT